MHSTLHMPCLPELHEHKALSGKQCGSNVKTQTDTGTGRRIVEISSLIYTADNKIQHIQSVKHYTNSDSNKHALYMNEN